MLVVDASVAVQASQSPRGFDVLGPELVAPALMWSEMRSAFHEAVWRGEMRDDEAQAAIDAIADAGIERRDHADLGARAWSIANDLGWAKTYDAEYVALAQLLGCRMVTMDRRLHRGAARFGFVISPAEI